MVQNRYMLATGYNVLCDKARGQAKLFYDFYGLSILKCITVCIQFNCMYLRMRLVIEGVQ